MSNVVPLSATNQCISVLTLKPCPKADSPAKAFATVEVSSVVFEVAVLQARTGNYFVGYPYKKLGNGKTLATVEVREPTRSQLERSVIEAAQVAGFI